MRVEGDVSMMAGREPLQAPPPSVQEVLYRTSQGQPFISGMVARALLDLAAVPDRTVRDGLLGVVLTGLMARGPVEDEIVEALTAALSLDDGETVELVSSPGSRLLMVAGSGKKGIKSFNISTSSAIVAAAAGAVVVKMGSRGTSSALGSRDLVETIGLPQSRTSAEVVSAVDRRRLAFVPIEEMIPVLDGVYGGRFHVLNPFSFGLAALAARLRGGVLIYGLAHPKVDLAARVLCRFEVTEAVIVASGNARGRFSDELGLGDRSLTCELRAGAVGPVRVYRRPELGFGSAGTSRIRPPSSGGEALRWVLDALAGQGDPVHVHLVALNAALMLRTAGLARDLADGYDQAEATIRSGRAWAKVECLRKDTLCQQTV